MSDNVEGLEKPDGSMSYYELVRIDLPASNGNTFLTAATIQCNLCGRMIAGMGGPGRAICIPCGNLVEGGQARGAIKWD